MKVWILLALVFSTTGEAAPAPTETDPWLVWADEQPAFTTFTLSQDELSTLATVPPGGTVELKSLAKAVGMFGRIPVKRIELFAEGARTMLPDGTVLPRDDRLFFLGYAGGLGVGLSFDPRHRRITGTLQNHAGMRELTSRVDGAGGLVVEAVAGPKADERIRSCEVDHAVHGAKTWIPGVVVDPPRVRKGVVEFEAAVAIDTDNEFLANKFGDNTTTAEQWISDMFLAMNVFMQRDLALRFVRSTTILRPSGQPDPYDSNVGNGFNFLGEFGGVWINDSQLAQIDRDFAALLSGRNINSNSFSGIAWINAYCRASPNPQNFGSFSVNRIGSAGFISPGFIAGGFGHELGHNLGSRHTHCETLRPGGGFVDQCFTDEFPGCYSGPTSCPADNEIVGNPPNTGSVMSYCNFSQASGGPPPPCNSSDFFHPLIAGKLSGLIDANTPSCLTAVAVSSPPSAISDSIEVGSGSTVVTLAAVEEDGDNVTFAITDAPDNGSLGAIGATDRDGSDVTATVTYTPTGGFTGADSFSFSATDTDGSSTGTITIDVSDRVFADGFERR